MYCVLGDVLEGVHEVYWEEYSSGYWAMCSSVYTGCTQGGVLECVLRVVLGGVKTVHRDVYRSVRWGLYWTVY